MFASPCHPKLYHTWNLKPPLKKYAPGVYGKSVWPGFWESEWRTTIRHKKIGLFLSESQKKLRFIQQFSWKIKLYQNAWKTNVGAISPSSEKTRVYVQLMYQSWNLYLVCEACTVELGINTNIINACQNCTRTQPFLFFSLTKKQRYRNQAKNLWPRAH